MRAVVITRPGGADVLQVQEVPELPVGPGDVRIGVRATALNRADLLQRQGHYPPPEGSPPYPGLECAGEVMEVGSDVTGWRPGDRVMALLGGGGYAEQVVTPAETVMTVPEGMSWEEAAAIPEAWLTAYSNMIQIGRLAAGERVLVHAGGSGVGSAAIQLAKWWGATVYSTASAPKLDALRALGADITIDYRSENFAERVLAETNGEGVNLIVDFIGAPYWDDNMRALSRWGRLVLVGLMGGRQVDANLGLFLSKKLSVHGSTLRDRTTQEKGALIESFAQSILPALASGALKPVLDDRHFTLDTIVDAHRYMESNGNTGKIVVVTAEG